MPEYWQILLDLIAQFTGGRGGVDHNIVQFVLAASMWLILVGLAVMRYRNSNLPHEELMIIGFFFGFLREIIMLSMALLQAFGIVPGLYLHVVFPPLEHALFDIAIIVVASSFMRYLLHDWRLSKAFMQAGVFLVCLCYLATFWWWGNAVLDDPQLTFGKTWCDWLFRINASILLIYPITVLLHLTKGLTRNLVCFGLTCFFLNQFLKIPDMMFFEIYEHVFAPIRHGLYLMGIPMIGFVYVRELYHDHINTENKLQASEKRYRALFDESLDTLYVSSNDGKFLDMNQAGLEMFEISREELSTVNISDLYFNPDDRTKFQKEIERKGAVHGYELDLRKKNGLKMSCLVSASLRFDHQGEIAGYQGIIRNVTLQRKIEGQLRQSEKMEAMGTLAGGIAHDFNNILTAIIGYAFIAKRALPKESPAEKAIAEIHNAGNRAKDLVRQILAFSRRDEQVKKPLYLQVIIKEALKLLRATIPVTIEINNSISDQLSPVLAEPTQILQLLLNLCTNAVHALGEEGRIDIRIDDCYLSKSDQELPVDFDEGRYVKLSVSDNGQGVSPEIISRIFDPFFTTKEVGEGTGMGLSVVHGIVKTHKGFVTVDSALEVGTTFNVYFPALEQFDSVSSDQPVFKYQGTERILFVDDEQTIANLTKLTLVEFGYHVTSLTSASEALALIEENPQAYDLVITDQTMPELSGVDLAKKIMAVNPDLPIVLCTGYSAVIDEEKAKEIGIKAFVLKPLVEQKLAKVVRNVLDE